MTDQVQAYYMNLPTTVRGFVTFGEDAEPIIVLNARMTAEQQRKTYRHELRHINRDHLFDDTYVEYGDAYG